MKTGLKRILVVDDAATVRMYHKQILQQAGYLVDEAVNGLDALEKALLSPYDLYLVDINMPKLDGYDFLKDLRSRDIFQGPAIMISTEAQQHDKLRAFASGANLYMVKPIKPAELLKYCA
ncbi:response regulator, partial [Aeromonas hydrophila]|uniref:response regulator n=1 Tax=Aeromonas hydrophila TaxID=644 RepID=UPI003F66552E